MKKLLVLALLSGWGACVRATDWSLNIVSDRPGYSGTLRVEGNRLLLDLCGPGLVIVVE